MKFESGAKRNLLGKTAPGDKRLSAVNLQNIRKAYDLTHKNSGEIPPFNFSVGRKNINIKKYGEEFELAEKERKS